MSRASNDRPVVLRGLADVSSIGSNTVVAGVTNLKIRVLSMLVVSAAANTVTFRSASTDISADNALAANGGFTLPYNPEGWFETVAGEALNVNLTAANAVAITLTYELVWGN